MEIEDCFLLGDFGVTRDRRIVAEPARLHFGDWTTQGYPHFAGSMIYHGNLEFDPAEGPVRVWLGEYEAVHVAVHVNGEVVGHIPWADANGLDITSSLRLGHNDIGIEVVSSPRNMLGPLHLATGREAWTDWRSFRRTDETYTPDYVLKAWGSSARCAWGATDRAAGRPHETTAPRTERSVRGAALRGCNRRLTAM